MKKLFIALSALALAACDMRPPLKVGYEPPPDLIEETDSTFYGFCGKGSTASRLQIITSTDDTVTIDVDEARRKGRVLAGYNPGDEIYVVPATDHSKALMTINKTKLLGEWVMPSPYDGSSPSGIVLKDGGEAESFGQQGDIIYKSWRIVNGRLQIVETRDDGTDIYETQTYDIVRMTTNPDSLYLKNEEESFEYGRYIPETFDDLGVEFDENSEEDYDLF